MPEVPEIAPDVNGVYGYGPGRGEAHCTMARALVITDGEDGVEFVVGGIGGVTTTGRGTSAPSFLLPCFLSQTRSLASNFKLCSS